MTFQNVKFDLHKSKEKFYKFRSVRKGICQQVTIPWGNALEFQNVKNANHSEQMDNLWQGN